MCECVCCVSVCVCVMRPKLSNKKFFLISLEKGSIKSADKKLGQNIN